MQRDRHGADSPPPERHGRSSNSSINRDDELDSTPAVRNPYRIFREDARPLQPSYTTGPANVTQTSTSRLGPVALDFIKISMQDTTTLVHYIAQNQHQLLAKTSPSAINGYLHEAENALSRNDESRARSCIEKGIIVDDCTGMNSTTLTKYLTLLVRKDPNAVANFETKYKACMERCKSQLRNPARRATDSASTVPQMREARGVREEQTGGGRHAPYTASQPRPIPHKNTSTDDRSYGSPTSDRGDRHSLAGSMQRMNMAEHMYSMSPQGRHTDSTPIGQTSTSKVTTSGRHTSGLNEPDPSGGDPGGGTHGFRRAAAPDRHAASRNEPDPGTRDPGGGTHGWPSHGWRTVAQLGDNEDLSRGATFRGPPGNAPPKDPRDRSYIRRSPKEAGSFFAVGRVFAVLQYQDDTTTSGTRSTSRIHGRISRFVVVRKGHGFTWCVPISTYGGRGVGKSGFSDADKKAHAIIHTKGEAPRPVQGESGMIKQPLAVDSEDDVPLDVASRVDFSRVHTVEHNVRAKNIGRIHPSDASYRRFVAYWQQELEKTKSSAHQQEFETPKSSTHRHR